MQVTVTIPEEIAGQLPDMPTMSRQLLEAYAIEGYRNERLTRHQVGTLLGLDRWQTEAFLAEHQAQQVYTLQDWEFDREALELR